MSLKELNKKIQDKQASLAVIGLGYVGLPLACKLAQADFLVTGVDVQEDIVRKINLGISPIEGDEPGLAELLASVVADGRLHATSNYQELRSVDILLIAVETPVDSEHTPDYRALIKVLSQLGPVLKIGALVIIESTLAPGTMDHLVVPTLEQSTRMRVSQDFYAGHCPERVMPGKLLANLENMSRVVGGMSPDTSETMVLLYRHFVQADLDPVDCVTAELVKTTENAYRDVQIAFANEVALICEAISGDVWKVRELVNKSPFRNMHLPGAGVGGHCIPKDPWLLAYGALGKDVPLRLIPAARAVNDSMPLHMVQILEQALYSSGLKLAESRILMLGYAYLENSDDTRNSPSEAVAQHLRTLGAEVVIHDPYVSAFQGNLYQKAADCHAIISMVAHQDYRLIDLAHLRSVMETGILVDGRAIFDPAVVIQAGFHYRRVGLAQV